MPRAPAIAGQLRCIGSPPPGPSSGGKAMRLTAHLIPGALRFGAAADGSHQPMQPFATQKTPPQRGVSGCFLFSLLRGGMLRSTPTRRFFLSGWSVFTLTGGLLIHDPALDTPLQIQLGFLLFCGKHGHHACPRRGRRFLGVNTTWCLDRF